MNDQRLYFDQDSSDVGLVGELVRRGFDCLVTRAAGMARASDDDQLRYARAHLRLLVTHNKGDFTRLHRDWLRAGETHSGIIVIAQEFDRRQKLRRLTHLLNEVAMYQFVDRIEYLSRWSESD